MRKLLVFTFLLLSLSTHSCENSSAQTPGASPQSLPSGESCEEVFTVSREADSWREFAENCRFAYNENRNCLANKWQTDDGKLLEALYYLNVVGHLWAYGNLDAPDQVGCVEQNEDTDHQYREPEFRDYMECQIGCCQDHALAMYEILTANGFDVSRVSSGGHMWVETEIDGQIWTLDATMMAAFRTQMPGTWSLLMSIFFEHPGEDTESPLYRSIVKDMRTDWFDLVLRKQVTILARF